MQTPSFATGARRGQAPGLTLFFAVFLYALAVGLFIQTVLLPHLLPALHGGHGLLKGGDWLGFHADAAALAERIRAEGWSSWALPPQNSGLISIVAAVYALTGVCEPWILLPVNAAVFALGALCLFDILRKFAGRSSWALIGTAPYVLFPSAALIYSQIHKDVWTVTGSLLIVHALLTLAGPARPQLRDGIKAAAMTLLAVVWIWFMRPYLLQIIFLSAVGGLAVFAVMSLRALGGPGGLSVGRWTGAIVCLVVIAIPAFAIPEAGTLDVPRRTYVQIVKQVERQRLKSKRMRDRPENPVLRAIDRRVSIIAEYRHFFVRAAPDAGSFIDADVDLSSIDKALAYTPRAMQIGLFAPFPDMWFATAASPGGGAMRALNGLEMALSYVLLAGLVPLIILRRSQWAQLAMVIAFVTAIIVGLVYIFPNVGTLVRMRFAYQLVLLGLGIVGWCAWLWPLLARSGGTDEPETPGMAPKIGAVPAGAQPEKA